MGPMPEWKNPCNRSCIFPTATWRGYFDATCTSRVGEAQLGTMSRRMSSCPRASRVMGYQSLFNFPPPYLSFDFELQILGLISLLKFWEQFLLWPFLGFITRIAGLPRHHRYAALDFAAGPLHFSYAELRKATQKFDERNLLGAGGSGSVYRGTLEGPSGGRSVAVKQINFSESKLAEALFQAEVSSLRQIQHRNVVQLLGWCREKGRLLLVYDYMSNGGLDECLHQSGGRVQRQVLSLQMRHSVLEGVGAALEYLHEDCQRVVVHRDIKSSNVLLDAEFKPHLGDFGLARLMDHPESGRTTLPAGTLGYMAPEIPYTGKATKELDVYSFGMLVLEVICGRRPLDMQVVEPENLMLLNAVWRAHEARSPLAVVDPRLLQTRQH